MRFAALALIPALLASSAPAKASPQPLCVAHRGNSAEQLENSLAALRSAADLGAAFVEFDVRHTADGVGILMHDAKLERTTRTRAGAAEDCPRGKVSEQLWAQVRERCELLNGEPVPTIDDAIAVLKPTRSGLFVELKDRPSGATLSALTEAFATHPDRVRYISFKAKLLSELAFRAESSLLVAAGAGLFHVSALSWYTTVGMDGVSVNRPTRAAVRRLQERGLGVSVWTVDRDEAMLKYADWGVDYLTTNRVRACLSHFPAQI
ncbi:MAG: hypothetical protein IT285_12530 [Bdellovibrionales bacterium]|nr:hypothetical protein [Bdellovibrionales bacterium]